MTNEAEFLEELNSRLEVLTEKRTSFKGMLYGESGVGKTVTAVALAQKITDKNKAILHVDSGQGWVSLNNHPKLKKGVKSFRANSLNEISLLARAIGNKVSDEWANVGCIILDEYSTYAAYDLLQVTRERAKRDSDKNPDEPKLPDFGVNGNRLKRFTGPLMALPDTHVIFVSHQRVDDVNARKVTSPAFTPSFGAHIRGLLHLVGYLTADEVVESGGEERYNREIQVQPTKNIVAKTRVGGFSSLKVTIPELLNNVKGWLDGEIEDNTQQEVVEDPVEDTRDPQVQAVQKEKPVDDSSQNMDIDEITSAFTTEG